MTLQECYAALDGNYEDVISRLRKDSLVQKFVLKFADDQNYELLCQSLENENYEDAFRAAHTIKGVCQNLSFTKLLDSSGRLTEQLRAGWNPEVPELMERVTEDYQQTISAIRTLKAELEG